MWRLAVVALIACAPDPFGVDCRTSPSCQKQQAERQEKAHADKRAECKTQKHAWVSHADFEAQKLPACDLAKHACTPLAGCPAGFYCVNAGDGESAHCDNGGSWEGHCVTCADRAALAADTAKRDAEFARVEKAEAEALARAEQEVKANACSEGGRKDAAAALVTVEHDWPVKGTFEKRGELLATEAGARVEIDAALGKRYTLTTIGTQKIKLETQGGIDWRSGSVPDVHHWVRESVVAGAAKVSWTVKGKGCVAWSLLRDERVQ